MEVLPTVVVNLAKEKKKQVSERSLFIFWVGLLSLGCGAVFVYNCYNFSKFKVDTKVALNGKYTFRTSFQFLWMTSASDFTALNVQLHVCAPTEQVFNATEYNKKTGSQLTLNLSSKAESENSRNDLISQVSTKHLLEFTPKVDDVLESCILRQLTDSFGGSEEYGRELCNKWIKVQKFLSNTDFCLLFKFSQRKGSIIFQEVSFDPLATGIVREITLNKSLFKNVSSFKLFYGLEDKLSYQELQKAPTVDRGYNYTTGNSFYNNFGIRFRVVSSQGFLPIANVSCAVDRNKRQSMASRKML